MNSRLLLVAGAGDTGLRLAAGAAATVAVVGLQTLRGRSPRELHAEQVIMAQATTRPVSALGCGLRPLVGILDGSALVLSPDTGPLHMTVALDRPVISLIGHLNPKRVGPYRRYRDLMIDAYGEPGEDYAISMDARPGRMERISVQQVLDMVERWRARYASGSAPRVSAP